MKRKFYCRVIIFVFGLIVSSLVALESIIPGDDQGALEKELEFLEAEKEVIYAATKSIEPVKWAPGSVSVINYAQIRKSGARTIPELLRLISGVNVRWNPMMQTIDIRGFGSSPFTNQVLLLIDGVPYNSWNKGGFPQQPGFDFFVLQNIKRLEVIKNPGSVLYGENAYRGVINIVSLSGGDFDGGKIEFFGGDRESREIGALFGKEIGDGSILFSGKVSQGQFPMEFWFDENDSTVNGTDLFFKGTYKGFELSYYRHEDSVDGFSDPERLPEGFAFQSPPGIDIEQIIDILALKFNHKTEDDAFSFGVDFSWARRKGMHCGACHASPESEDFEKIEDHGSQILGDIRLGIHSIPYNDILIGIEAREIDAADHDDELLTEDEAPEGIDVVQKYKKPAIYIQDQIKLLDDTLRVNAGVRYDAESDPNLINDRFSPRISLVFNPTESLTLRSSWSKAFRTPSFSELYQDSWFFNMTNGEISIPLGVFDPNPNLKSEKIQTYDVGLEYRLSSKLSIKVDAFYSEVEDFIVTVYEPQAGPILVRSENHPDTVVTMGTETELRWQLSRRYTGFFNWSYQKLRPIRRST